MVELGTFIVKGLPGKPSDVGRGSKIWEVLGLDRMATILALVGGTVLFGDDQDC